MLQQAIDLNVNPSNETTLVAPLAVRFPIMGEGYSGSDAAQKFTGPGAQPPAVPTHSDDQYKQTIDGVDGVLTWTVDETQFDVSECIPCGAIPRFDNNAFRPGFELCVTTPAAAGLQYFPRARRRDKTRRPVPSTSTAAVSTWPLKLLNTRKRYWDNGEC